MTTTRSPRDVVVGENLTRLRAGMTQQALADAMRERGWRWSQATVWAVEKGERPLKFSEAEDVAEILGINVQGLSRPTELALRHSELQKAGRELVAAWNDAVAASHALDRARDNLVHAMRQAEQTPGISRFDAAQGIEHWKIALQAMTPEAVHLEAETENRSRRTRAEVDRIEDYLQGVRPGDGSQEAREVVLMSTLESDGTLEEALETAEVLRHNPRQARRGEHSEAP